GAGIVEERVAAEDDAMAQHDDAGGVAALDASHLDGDAVEPVPDAHAGIDLVVAPVGAVPHALFPASRSLARRRLQRPEYGFATLSEPPATKVQARSIAGTRRRMRDILINIFKEQMTDVRIAAARIAPGLCRTVGPRMKRAQGMPDAGRTRSSCVQK